MSNFTLTEYREELEKQTGIEWSNVRYFRNLNYEEYVRLFIRNAEMALVPATKKLQEIGKHVPNAIVLAHAEADFDERIRMITDLQHPRKFDRALDSIPAFAKAIESCLTQTPSPDVLETVYRMRTSIACVVCSALPIEIARLKRDIDRIR